MKERYWRVFSLEQGESHAKEVDAELELRDYAPPAPPVFVSRPGSAAGFVFVVAPQTLVGGFHPAPRRELQVVLRGVVEVETSDGTLMRGEPGDAPYQNDSRREARHRRRDEGERGSASQFLASSANFGQDFGGRTPVMSR